MIEVFPSPLLPFLLFLLLPWLGSARALVCDPDRRPSVVQWSTHEGLPTAAVQAVVQGARGYVWIGTQSGLVRFDGQSFRLYGSSVEGLDGDDVQALLVDPRGGLWIGTDGGGLSRFAQGRFRAYHRADGLPSERVRALAWWRGAVWVGTSRGLARVGRQGRPVPVPAVGDRRVRLLYADGGRLWVLGDGAPCAFTGEGCTQPGGIPPGLGELRAVFRDRSGDLWLGGWGVVHLHGEQVVERWRAGEELPGVPVTVLFEDRDGTLWAGTEGRGLYRLLPGRAISLGGGSGGEVGFVRDIAEDREGGLWVATLASGLFRYSEGVVTTYGSQDGLPAPVVLCALQSAGGELWVGTLQGLALLRRGEAVDFPGRDALSGTPVTALYLDDEDALWVGTFGRGLYRLDGEALQHWGPGDGLPDDTVYAVTSALGTTWVGTASGLARWDAEAGRWVSLPEEAGLAAREVRALLRDREGRLWVGSTGGGVQLWEGGRFAPPLEVPGAPGTARQVLSLYEDHQGVLWAGTDGGLLRFGEEGRALRIGHEQGLREDRVYAVLQDGRGDYWFSSMRGLARVRADELQALVDGRSGALHLLYLDREDGLVSEECNGGSQPSAWEGRDGRLYFATMGGLVALDPEHLSLVHPPPPAVIESVRVDGRELELWRGELRVPPGRHRLIFRFTAPTFNSPSRLRFRFRLDGWDVGWEPGLAERLATYTNLPPGSYRFRVQASADGLHWGASAVSPPIELEPRFTQTLLFRLLVALLGLGAVLGVQALASRALRRRNEELERLVRERTRELEELALRDPLTGLRNRRYFYETVTVMAEAALKQRRGLRERGMEERRAPLPDRMGLAILDLDHFKQVNDRHGHEAGDALLVQFAALLKRTARQRDLVVRWGGEEFLVVMPGTDGDGALRFAERLREPLQEDAFLLPDGRRIQVTCSIGCAVFPFYDGADVEPGLDGVLAAADHALYRAKEAGRNRVAQALPGPHRPCSEEDAERLFHAPEEAEAAGALRVVVHGPEELPAPEGPRERRGYEVSG